MAQNRSLGVDYSIYFHPTGIQTGNLRCDKRAWTLFHFEDNMKNIEWARETYTIYNVYPFYYVMPLTPSVR